MLERGADAVSEWAADSSLRRNETKTKAIMFGVQLYVSKAYSEEDLSLSLSSGVRIPFSETVTSLGVILDSKLSWKPHITQVVGKFNRILYTLRFFRKYTTEALRKQLAMALLFPYLDYCTVALLDLTQEMSNKLQVLQNSGVRYVLGVGIDESITPHRKKLGWLTVSKRRDYFLGLQIYKVLRLRQPAYLADLFTIYVPRRPVRGEVPELSIPFARIDAGKYSFQCAGARFWNTLPSTIRHQPSIKSFKKSLWAHLSAD